MILRLLVGATLLAPSSLLAQNAGTSVVAPIAAPATSRAMLRTGTEVPLRLMEELTTKGKHLRVGQRIRMETAEALMVQGVTVVPVGTPAVGEITDVTNKGMWGKSGHLGGRVLYLMVNGRQIRLSGAFDDKGVAGGVGAVAVSAIVFLPAGFFMTGTSAKLPAGTVIKGFVDEDVPLEIAAATLGPMTVGGPAPALAAVTNVAQAYDPGAVAAAPMPVGSTPRLKAKSPSGYCYDVPKDYVGLGTVDKPSITTYSPACWQVSKGS
jgi:hypothetical protein